MSEYTLEFYRTESGEEPALDYIRAQPKSHRWKIGKALCYLEENGHLARRPQVDYLGDKIYELRIPIEHHQHRLLFFFHDRTLIVIAIGILKNEREVPESELERARRCRVDWLRQQGENA